MSRLTSSVNHHIWSTHQVSSRCQRIMHAFVLIVLCVAVGVRGSSEPKAVKQLPTWRELSSIKKHEYTFHHFETEFGRVWATDAERATREAIFTRNLEAIHTQNAERGKGESSWSAGVNQFTDMRREELPTGIKRSRRATTTHQSLAAGPASQADTPKTLPTSVDWRTKGVVTAVKDQGPCGSCWAFSATETVESAVAIATGKLIELAPQELVDCVTNPDVCGGVGGCGGATQELGFAYVMLNGMAAGISYPYQAHDGPCLVGTAARGKNVSVVAGITNFVKLPANDNGALLEAVADHGPVAITVAADWGNYESGVYDGCSKNSTDIDHGVQVVGYGEDAGDLYWIVRNSWGATWGNHGYINLKRYPTGEPECQTDTSPGSGSGCAQSPTSITVCGECGMLSDSSYPVGGYVRHV